MDMAALKNEVATLECETANVEFKSGDGTTEPRFWPQIMRSVLAMHNSGGGVIVFGLCSKGQHTATDLAAIRKIDPVQISQQVKKYADRPLPNVVVQDFERNGHRLPGWIIPAATSLIPFSRDGDVHTGKGKPDKEFHSGQIYVRRGASSVPADANDMQAIFDRVRHQARHEFWTQISQISVMPQGHAIHILPQGSVVTTKVPTDTVRITTDADAPAAMVVDKFKTHPYRMTELVKRLATRLPQTRTTTHDITCIRKVYADEIESKGFMYSPPHSSPHYSEQFAEWIVGQVNRDAGFMDKTRARCKARDAA